MKIKNVSRWTDLTLAALFVATGVSLVYEIIWDPPNVAGLVVDAFVFVALGVILGIRLRGRAQLAAMERTTVELRRQMMAMGDEIRRMHDELLALQTQVGTMNAQVHEQRSDLDEWNVRVQLQDEPEWLDDALAQPQHDYDEQGKVIPLPDDLG